MSHSVFKSSFKWNGKRYKICQEVPSPFESVISFSTYYFISRNGENEGYFDSIAEAIDYIKNYY